MAGIGMAAGKLPRGRARLDGLDDRIIGFCARDAECS
jgi:hypothetical protein